MAAEAADVTEDAVLGGRLVLRQPRRGHRVGHDAMLLAAAVAARSGEHAVDLGAGVGAAGLALARRVERLSVTMVDIDPALVALACENILHNGFAEGLRAVCLDVAAPVAAFAAAGLAPGGADHVLMNPPFNAPQHNPSPHRGRRLAHAAGPDALSHWLKAASRLLRASGTLTLIWRADGLASVLAALSAAGFGGLALRPIHPKPVSAAIRVLVRGALGSRAPLTILPGLFLADAGGKPSAEADAILRDGASLPMTIV